MTETLLCAPDPEPESAADVAYRRFILDTASVLLEVNGGRSAARFLLATDENVWGRSDRAV